MFTFLQRSALFVSCLFLAACSMVTVTTDYDHSASFAKYHTYTLTPLAQEVPLSPSSETALRESLRAHLAARGLTEVEEGADLHIVRHVSAQEKIAISQSPGWGPYGGVPYRYGRYGMWAGATYTDVSQYTEGTLILDFVDAKTQKLVFRGIGKGTIGDPETNAKRIREAVEKIVQSYPGSYAAGYPGAPHP
ncbi:DUF4136 domain-containing protein [Methylococcus sp. EFPC2]|uniref:DUF4136 domain-containing protein n=1 Tax=Methylococcus sp. EFPC2 TaxID=2812648 RepID=UPI001967C4BD|nr:DUF4136 domain-containing protein [Methylococcus sp. EFPC2]QSA97836.1 DUF4136 domain-containing protein [Methylococcus sp. EFPC2]